VQGRRGGQQGGGGQQHEPADWPRTTHEPRRSAHRKPRTAKASQDPP
jgi:hypothetical protein